MPERTGLTRQAKIMLGVMGGIIILFIGGAATYAIATNGLSLDTESTSRCRPANDDLVSGIEEGLDTGISLRAAHIVRSDDYSRVYFVAADLQGPGLNGSDDIAVWATNRTKGTGLIFSADAVAREFSDWGSNDFKQSDDGHKAARDCVKDALS